jgi:FG-GAP repeat
MRSAPAALLIVILASSLDAQVKLADFRGSEAYDGFGTALDACGDLDGDGLPDLAIGVPLDKTNGWETGRLVVVASSDGAPLVRGSGSEAGQWFAFALATVGDVDGDGFPDLVVGSPRSDAGSVEDAGRVLLMSGATGAVLHAVSGSGTLEQLGSRVSATGDLDADGLPDFAAAGEATCEPFPCWPAASQAFSGATAAALTGHPVGLSVKPAGDVDGDGHDDYLSWSESDGSGVRLRSGATGAVLDSLLDPLNQAMVIGGPAADVDGDGRREYVFASYTWVPQLITLSLRSLGKPPLLEVHSVAPFGAVLTVDARADVTGDGVADFVVGQPQLNFGTTYPAYGALRVYSGADGALVSQIDSQTSDANIGQMGGVLTLLGDWNGDGLFDIAAGTWNKGLDVPLGHVNVFSVPLEAGWATLGHALAGTYGPPLLTGHGQFAQGGVLSLDLVSAASHASTTLVIGLSQVDLPFKGGVLVPSADVVITGLDTTSTGWFSLQAHAPAGVPAGVTLAFQAWVADTATPSGYSASNGLQLISQG